ncbi:unnamed protein product [Parascedosporium putredinis]|uniref:Protein kinase domain-containing protein n=1 Tax=Parascedosporium putredinis TaxID=1442378 RepID=A0A9P1H0X8_9PEZI|nr:unnamed protein product [Parascedosporium putredinis]CAI7993110.1 unnamed protein product [Parascedosporium putredinis]
MLLANITDGAVSTHTSVDPRRLGLDITSGLGALHAHGVVHGDLKPNNILVFNEWGRGYTAKLADFGSAILLSETEFPCRAPPGTRVYRAPECSDDSASHMGYNGCSYENEPLAASRDEELQWLTAASRAGSSIAQRRFRDLDKEGFATTMRSVRQAGRLIDVAYSYLHESAITGNVEPLSKVPPELPSGIYEYENFLGETALVVACRGGHTAVMEILLSRGANAAHETARGVTPLHFLAAFDDDDIPRVISALIQHGAEVDRICKRELIYKELFDSPFGQIAGTPLAWAVAAGNHCAVQALLARGADPFTMERYSPRYSGFDFGESPITRAAASHQFEVLNTLINTSSNGVDLRKRFITKCAVAHGQGFQVFSHALDCHSSFRFREYVLHGREYQQMASLCLSLLVESGMDLVRFTKLSQPGRGSKITHPIASACASCNIAILRYLWDYQNGILRPTPEIWVIGLSILVFEGFKEGFDFLIDSRGDVTADIDLDVRAIEKILSLTNDPYFTTGILRLLQRPGIALLSADAFRIFYAAITTEHFEVARRILLTYKVNPARRRAGNTLLYDLINRSYDIPNMESKISFILSLPLVKDILFWNIGYFDHMGATALYCAASLPSEKRPASPGVFDIVIENFSDPRYLNAQLQGHPSERRAGYTALHIAVERSNFDAVARLVERPGIEMNLKSSEGLTPIDICVGIYLELERMGSRMDKTQTNRSTANMSIIDLLINAENEGRISKYSTLLLRRTEDEFTLVDALKGKLDGVTLRGEV